MIPAHEKVLGMDRSDRLRLIKRFEPKSMLLRERPSDLSEGDDIHFHQRSLSPSVYCWRASYVNEIVFEPDIDTYCTEKVVAG